MDVFQKGDSIKNNLSAMPSGNRAVDGSSIERPMWPKQTRISRNFKVVLCQDDFFVQIREFSSQV